MRLWIMLALVGSAACQKDKKAGDDAAKTESAEEAPAFELGACNAEAETFEGKLKVAGEVEGQAFGDACVAGAIETERLGTTAVGLAYNIVCKSTDAKERLSFWVKGFTVGSPFGTRDNWSLLPNVSMQVDAPAGRLKRDSFAAQPEHVLRLGGVVWSLEGGEVGEKAPFPVHTIKGCVEGKFAAHGEFKAGSIKVLFNVETK